MKLRAEIFAPTGNDEWEWALFRVPGSDLEVAEAGGEEKTREAAVARAVLVMAAMTCKLPHAPKGAADAAKGAADAKK